jgi:hypothetical protein
MRTLGFVSMNTPIFHAVPFEGRKAEVIGLSKVTTRVLASKKLGVSAACLGSFSNKHKIKWPCYRRNQTAVAA